MKSKEYAEVYQIIQYLPESEYKLIPKEQIDYIKENMDTDMEKICTLNTKIEDIHLSMEAKTILLTLFYMYIANDMQKRKLEKLLSREEKNKIYNTIFDINKKRVKTNITDNKSNNKETALVEIDEKKWYFKMKKIIKRIFEKLKIKR